MLKNKNVLFITNTLPEYRLGWFEEMNKLCMIKFAFTNESLNKKTYGFNIDYTRANSLDCFFMGSGIKFFSDLKALLSSLQQYDFVELPPIDSKKEVLVSFLVQRRCKKLGIKTGYFWEKWEAPIDNQPLKRRVKNLILRVVPKFIYNHCAVIFAAGTKSKEYFLANGISEDKITIIPNCSETPACEYQDLRKLYQLDEHKKIILYLGRVTQEKGADQLIRAFSKIENSLSEKSCLMIAGDGDYLPYCKKLAQELNAKNIVFTGAIPPQDRANYFSQCDVFVYPVTYRGGWVDVWGLTLNEALQHGKVILASKAVGSAWDLIEEGVNGFMFETENTDDLKYKLSLCLSDKMSKSAKEKSATLHQKYCFKNLAKVYCEAIVKLL